MTDEAPALTREAPAAVPLDEAAPCRDSERAHADPAPAMPAPADPASAAGAPPRGPAPGGLDQDPSAVLALLEPDQLVAGRVTYGPRRLSPGLRVVLWALRLYVVFMLIVVAIQVARGVGG